MYTLWFHDSLINIMIYSLLSAFTVIVIFVLPCSVLVVFLFLYFASCCHAYNPESGDDVERPTVIKRSAYKSTFH